MSDNAMRAMPPRDGFWYEALRHCDKHDRPREDAEHIAHALRHQAFMRAIQPYLKIRANLYMLSAHYPPTLQKEAEAKIEEVRRMAPQGRTRSGLGPGKGKLCPLRSAFTTGQCSRALGVEVRQ